MKIKITATVAAFLFLCLVSLPSGLSAADTDTYYYRACAIESIPFSLEDFIGTKTAEFIVVYSLSQEGETDLFDRYTFSDGSFTFIDSFDGKLYIYLTDDKDFTWDENHVSMSGAPVGGLCTVVLNAGVRPCPDLTDDGCLDVADVVLLKSKKAAVNQPSSDLDGDGAVTDADVLILQRYVLSGEYALPNAG